MEFSTQRQLRADQVDHDQQESRCDERGVSNTPGAHGVFASAEDNGEAKGGS